MTDERRDRDAILARRAMLLSTALATLHCAGGSNLSTTSSVVGDGAGSAVRASATGSQARPVVPEGASWDEVMRAAPPRGVPEGLSEAERQRFDALEKDLESKYFAVRQLWEQAPDCDAAEPTCKPTWRTTGKLARQMFDVTRASSFGSGCGGRIGETGSTVGRRAAHGRFIAGLATRAEERLAARAAAFSAQGEQEWRKLAANARVTPPMPCLSPCAMPELSDILESVPFAKDDATLRLDDRAVLAALERTLGRFQLFRLPAKLRVRGHADAGEGGAAELAQARAKAVADWLVMKGVARDRVESKGFAASVPADRSDEDAGAAANRRADFETVPL